MLDAYPPEFWDEEQQPGFTAFERSINTRLIRGRDCRVTVASSERQECRASPLPGFQHYNPYGESRATLLLKQSHHAPLRAVEQTHSFLLPMTSCQAQAAAAGE